LEKRPLTVKFPKLCSKSFYRKPIDVVVFKFREIDGKSVKSYVIYLTKKFPLRLKLSLLRGSRPISARVSPNNVHRVLQIWSKSVHFRRSYSWTHEHRQIAPKSESNIQLKKPSFEPNKNAIAMTQIKITLPRCVARCLAAYRQNCGCF